MHTAALCFNGVIFESWETRSDVFTSTCRAYLKMMFWWLKYVRLRIFNTLIMKKDRFNSIHRRWLISLMSVYNLILVNMCNFCDWITLDKHFVILIFINLTVLLLLFFTHTASFKITIDEWLCDEFHGNCTSNWNQCSFIVLSLTIKIISLDFCSLKMNFNTTQW